MRTFGLIAVPLGSDTAVKDSAAFGLQLTAKRVEPFDVGTKPVVLLTKIITQVGGW